MKGINVIREKGLKPEGGCDVFVALQVKDIPITYLFTRWR